MTGDELTTLLLRHGVEVMGVDTAMVQSRHGGLYTRYTVHCRDVAATALAPEMLPANVELILHSETRRGRDRYLGDDMPISASFRDETRGMEGRGNFVLTSAPPRTSDIRVQPVRRNAVTGPSRRFDGPPAPAQLPTTSPRRVNDAELLTRLQSHLEASPRRFHRFTDAEIRTLGKSACTPPWQRLECVVLDSVAPASIAATVAQLLPSNVFLQLGDTTTGLWGSREDEVFVASSAPWEQPQSQPQQIGEAELRALVLDLPNVLGISGHIERGSRQRDRYIVRVTLIDRDVPLDSALAPRIPGNVHVHCQGRGEGGMRGVRGTGAMLYVPQHSSDHIVDVLTQTQQHLQRRLDYGGLIALLRRHLGDDVQVTSITAGREGHFDVEVAEWAQGNKIRADHLPLNISLVAHGRQLVGTSSQIFDPGRRVLVDKAPPTPRYFDADGDTITTPDKAPQWLHGIVAEVRAKSASWHRHGANSLSLYIALPFAHSLTRQHITRIQNNARPLSVTITSTNASAPRVPVCMVCAIREQRDLAVLTPTANELDLLTEWQQMPGNDWRNVVVDIVENGCAGLDDEAAAERASLYHTLMIEAAQAKTELAEYVRQWCAQFQTRFALLEVDDVDHTSRPRQTKPSILKHGKKPLTLAAVTKFRELAASRMCPSTIEAAKQAGIDSEVAVYVLQRWCGGLGDEEAFEVIKNPVLAVDGKTTEVIDFIAERLLSTYRPTLDVAAALPPSVQAADEAAKKQRLVLAQVAEQLRQERQRRAAQATAQPVQELTRFALLEVDEAADPDTATKAWHAQQARRRQPVVKVAAPISNEPTFTPPPPQHIHVPIPPHNGVDYVDATMLGQQLQDVVKVAGLVAAAEQSGLVKRVYEN